MKSEKKKKQKPKTRAAIEKWLARVLLLTQAKTQSSWVIDVVKFNAETKELVATDGKAMLIVKIKSTGTLLPFNLETGFYDVFGEILLKSDRDVDCRFPDYKGVISPNVKKVCSGDLLSGIIECMIKQQVYLDIWKYEKVLRILDKHFSYWVFAANESSQPAVMEADSDKYNIKYIIMPCRMNP